MYDNRDDDEADNLPRVHRSEREETPLDRLERTLRARDGPLSPSNAFVPPEPDDVGEDLREMARAPDLGYVEGADVEHRKTDWNMVVLFDQTLGASYNMWVDEGTFIEDVRNFN